VGASRYWRLSLIALIGLYRIGSLAQEAASKPEQSTQQMFRAAVAAYNAGRPAEATAILDQELLSVPNNFQVQELAGLAYGAQSQDAKAILHLQAAADLNPASAAARTNLATALLHADKSQEAEAQLTQALKLEPRNYTANHNLGGLLVREHRLAEAVPFLSAAQSAQPTAYENGYDLSLALLLTGNVSEARRQAEILIKQKDAGDLHNLLGRIDEKEGKFLAAADEFGVAAHMDPNEENLFVWASELLLHRTYQPAIDVFKEATERYPKAPRLWIGLGMALYSRGEYQEAVLSLLKAADLDPHDSRCYLFLSKAYLSSPNQAGDVISRFQKYAELEPDNAFAQYDYALGLWKGRRAESASIDYAKVESLLRRAIALDPALTDAHLQLGILYTDQRSFDAALPEYQRALQLDPNLSEAHFRLGRYYLHTGEKEKAQVELDTFKRLQAQHQAEVDKERAAVQQFVLNNDAPNSRQ